MRVWMVAAVLALLVSGCTAPAAETEGAPATRPAEPDKVQERQLWRGEAQGSTGMPFEVDIEVPVGAVALWVHQGPLTGAATGLTIESPCATWEGSTQQVSVAGGSGSWTCEDPPAGAGTVRVSAEGVWQTSFTVVAEVVATA